MYRKCINCEICSYEFQNDSLHTDLHTDYYEFQNDSLHTDSNFQSQSG